MATTPTKPASKPAAKKGATVDLLDILMDENNREPITLFDTEGKKLVFEQVAIIPYGKKDYVILKPMDKLPGIADNEAIVFSIEKNVEGETILQVETNEDTAISVFDEYYNLLEEETKKSKSAKKPAKK